MSDNEILDPATGELDKSLWDWEEVERQLISPDSQVVCAALHTVWKYGGSAPPLLLAVQKCLDHPDIEVRYRACSAIESAGSDANAALPRLIELVEKDPSQKIRHAACSALAIDQRQARLVLPVIREALKSDDGGMRECALLALRDLGPAAGEAVPEIIQSLSDNWSAGGWNPDDNSRAATEALQRVGVIAVPAIIEELSRKNSNAPTYLLLIVLGELGSEAIEALPTLKRLRWTTMNRELRGDIKEAIRAISRKKEDSRMRR